MVVSEKSVGARHLSERLTSCYSNEARRNWVTCPVREVNI